MTMQFSSQRTYRPPSRWSRVKHRFEGVSWFGIAAFVFWLGGIVVAFSGAFSENAWWVSFGFLLEVAAAVAVLISFREDKTT